MVRAASCCTSSSRRESAMSFRISSTRQLGWSHHFVTLVFVPLLGGIDGIVTAGALACKGHVDFALSFAVGGAIQVLLGVLPVLVLVVAPVLVPVVLRARFLLPFFRGNLNSIFFLRGFSFFILS